MIEIYQTFYPCWVYPINETKKIADNKKFYEPGDFALFQGNVVHAGVPKDTVER